MNSIRTELTALWQILKFFGGVFGLIAFGWFVIVASWAIFGN